MLWQLCLVLIGTYALIIYWKNRKFRNIFNKFPSKMRRVPFLEHSINFLGDSEVRMSVLIKFALEAMNDYDGMVGIKLGHKYMVVATDALDTEVILKNCLEKDESLNALRAVVGNGSVFAPVKIWRSRRKFLAPTFSQKTLNNFVKIFIKEAEVLAKILKDKVGDFSMFDAITGYSMDSVSETVLGVKLHAQRGDKHPMITAFYRFSDISCHRILRPWLHSDSIYRLHTDYPDFESSSGTMKRYVRKIVESKRQEVKEKQQTNKITDQDDKSLLEVLLESEEGKGPSDQELQEEALVMLVAGTDTSSVGMAFTSILLAKYPDIQEKVYQEIKDVIGDTKRKIEREDLHKLKYLEAVLRESLRLYPPVPLSMRTVNKDITLPSGITLCSGMPVMIHYWGNHRNPKYWGPDANQFKPERFLEPLKNPAAFVPFSGGPRNCLGVQYAMLSMKTVMATILSRFKILPATGMDVLKRDVIHEENEPVKFEVMMKHAGDFKVRLEPRD